MLRLLLLLLFKFFKGLKVNLLSFTKGVVKGRLVDRIWIIFYIKAFGTELGVMYKQVLIRAMVLKNFNIFLIKGNLLILKNLDVRDYIFL